MFEFFQGQKSFGYHLFLSLHFFRAYLKEITNNDRIRMMIEPKLL